MHKLLDKLILWILQKRVIKIGNQKFLSDFETIGPDAYFKERDLLFKEIFDYLVKSGYFIFYQKRNDDINGVIIRAETYVYNPFYSND